MAALTSDERLAQEAPIARAMYDTHVRPRLRPEDDGKFVAFTLDTGDYEVDEDDYTAGKRLQARRPDARLWLWRVGWQTACYARAAGAV